MRKFCYESDIGAYISNIFHYAENVQITKLMNLAWIELLRSVLLPIVGLPNPKVHSQKTESKLRKALSEQETKFSI